MNKPTLAILDADCFMYFAGWEYRERLNRIGELGAKKKLDKIISSILSRIKADYYIGFFGAVKSENFRYDVATIKPYKGSRTSPPWQEYFKPILKQHYIDKWSFVPIKYMEADDAVIIAHNQFKDDYNIIHVGEDKDQRQLGEFTRYNPRTSKIEKFNHIDGRKFFYYQMLVGDSSDFIGGIEGVGEKSKLVSDLMAMENPTEEDLFNYVKAAYISKYGLLAQDIMTENFILLNMMKKPCFDYPADVKLIKINKQDFSNIKLLDI